MIKILCILGIWLLAAFVVGVAFGRFCAAGTGLDVRLLSTFGRQSDTLIDNLTPTENPIEEAV